MIVTDNGKCSGCGSCVNICHEHCMTLVDTKVVVDHAVCSSCTQCIAICPEQALSWDGAAPLAFDPSALPSPRQMDELFRRIKGSQENLDKGEAQMTFYQVKRLMKDLLKGYTMEEFWRLVEQVTRQKPKIPTEAKKSPQTADKLIA